MLKELRVKNLAVVEEASFLPGSGLNVVTGETGAGKSILVGAIELLFGGRADAEALRTGADQARIEGRFEFDRADYFRRRGVDLDLPESSLLVVREVTRAGRSRALVNDELVTVGRLRALGDVVADLHGQHEHQRLLRPESHVEYLDRYAATLEKGGRRGATLPLDDWRAARSAWLLAVERIRVLTARDGSAEERRGRLEAALAEIRAAHLVPGEESALREERQRLLHAEKLLTQVSGALELLDEGEGAVNERLGDAIRRLSLAASLDLSLNGTIEAIERSLIELQESARELLHYRDKLSFEPDRAGIIEERLALIGRLRKLHGADEAAIIARGVAIEAELDGLADESKMLRTLEAERDRTAGELVRAGLALREFRVEAARRLSRGARHELEALGMGESSLTIAVTPDESPEGLPVGDLRLTPGERGFDRVEFHLTANTGEEPRPLSRVASGGELSRVMLALKAILRAVDPLPILVFDEVDAGIGGRVATEVALRLKEIATGRQVFVVTHLAAIAARADHHFRVQKSVVKGRTVMTITRLEGAEREEELARMLAGAEGGEDARRTARALLDGARRSSS